MFYLWNISINKNFIIALINIISKLRHLLSIVKRQLEKSHERNFKGDAYIYFSIISICKENDLLLIVFIFLDLRWQLDCKFKDNRIRKSSHS